MARRSLLVLSVLALIAAGCNGNDVDDATNDVNDVTPADATVAVADSELGDILVDGDGMTLYLFIPDGQGEPTCVDDCVDIWPLLEAPAETGAGIDDALLGTVEHPSGVTQVTYNDWPLYYYAPDEAPGDVEGQGVGDNWFVVSPEGEPIAS